MNIVEGDSDHITCNTSAAAVTTAEMGSQTDNTILSMKRTNWASVGRARVSQRTKEFSQNVSSEIEEVFKAKICLI